MKRSAVKAMKAKQHSGKVMGWDLRLKKKVAMVNPVSVTMKNGRKAWKGTSAESGIKMFVIRGKND